MTFPVALRIGRNMRSLEYTSDPTERATRIAAKCATLADQPTYLGGARWGVTSPNSGAKTFVATDPAGNAGPIGFDGQCVGWYVWREATNEYLLITASVAATQLITLATWPSGFASGERFRFRTTAPGVSLAPYAYRDSAVAAPPAIVAVPIIDAEVTTLASLTITVRDGWLSGGQSPVAFDDQHVGRSVRLSELVATDVITSFAVVAGAYVYGFADVSAYQVGDWIRRAVDNSASFYGDISTLINPAFPAAMTIVAVDTGGNTVTVVSRDGGSSLNRVIYDTAIYGAGYTDARIYRPTATLRTVTASSGSAHTLTLNAVSGFSIGGGPGAVEILIPTSSASGLEPIALDHPRYVAPTFPGIGVKMRTVDRSTFVSVANVVDNAVHRVWSDATKLPDGWTYYPGIALNPAGRTNDPNSGSGLAITQNTDPLYWRVGGQSLGVSWSDGALVSPPTRWTPAYPGQSFSVRTSLLITAWPNANVILRMMLGQMRADGTVFPWFDTQSSILAVGPTSTRPGTKMIPPGVWDDLVVQGLDITAPSIVVPNARPNAADLADWSGALGIVLVLRVESSAGQAVTGYFDGVSLTPTLEAPATVSEFGDANVVHQSVNTVLAILAPPQWSGSVEVVDLKRMDPTLDEAALDKGALVTLNAADLGLLNVPQRIAEARRNELVLGDTTLVLQNRRKRFTEFVIAAQRAAQQSVASGLKSVAASIPAPTTPPVGTSIPSLALTATITSDVPTVVATVSPGVVAVQFASSLFGFPDAATVLAATVVTATPFTFTDSAMTPPETRYVSAIATDVNGVRSNLAQLTLVDPLSGFAEPGSAQTMPVDFSANFNTDAHTEWETGGEGGYVNVNHPADVFNATGGIGGSGCGEEHDPGGPNYPTYWEYIPVFVAGVTAHARELYEVARFNLNGKTVASDTPLIQGWPTTVGFVITPSRTVKLYMDDGSGNPVLLGESTSAVIPATGYCRIDLRGRTSATGTGLMWARVSTDPAVAGALVEFASAGGGANVHAFTGLTFSVGPNGSAIDSIATGSGSSNGDWNIGTWPGTMIDGVQWDNVAVLDPTGFGDYDWADNV